MLSIGPLGYGSIGCPCRQVVSWRPCGPKSRRSVTAACNSRRVLASGSPRRCGEQRQHHWLFSSPRCLLCLRFLAIEIKRLHHWRVGEAEQEGGAMARVDVLVESPRRYRE